MSILRRSIHYHTVIILPDNYCINRAHSADRHTRSREATRGDKPQLPDKLWALKLSHRRQLYVNKLCHKKDTDVTKLLFQQKEEETR